MEGKQKSKWDWAALLAYSAILLIAGGGISLLLVQTVPPNASFMPLSKSPHDHCFFIGCGLLMIIAPAFAFFLKWKLREFLVAGAIASGVLTQNGGFGIGFAGIGALAYLGIGKLAQIILFYFPRKAGEAAESDCNQGADAREDHNRDGSSPPGN